MLVSLRLVAVPLEFFFNLLKSGYKELFVVIFLVMTPYIVGWEERDGMGCANVSVSNVGIGVSLKMSEICYGVIIYRGKS